jgi:uncharacterized membrane protein YbhN (UPF0104 family)
MPKRGFDYKKVLLILFYSVAIAAFIYIVVTQFSDLKNSLKLILKSDIEDELVALGFVILTFVTAAQSYYFLSFKKLILSRSILVEFAVSTINRILPSGVGGLATNYLYLRKNDNSRIQATAVVAINNLLGFIANMGLLALLLIFVKTNPLSITRPNDRDILIVCLIVLIVVVLLFTQLRHKIFLAIRNTIKELKTYKDRKDALVYSFISQLSITLANVLALHFSLSAIHAHLALSSLMLSYSFAIWLSTVLPTPGGVGAVETGLTGALVAFGFKFDIALSAVLIFRLISFWIPFFIGAFALALSRKRKYL